MIEIGDFVPTFELRDQCGRQCFSGADLFSGDPRAYLFCPAGAGELTDKLARAFVDAADALRRAGGWAFLIMAEPDAVAGQFSGQDLDPVRLLSDPSGGTFGAFSLPPTTLADGQPQVVAIVLNANAQVDSTWVSADLEELVAPVLERLGDLAYRPHPVAAGANPPVLIIPGVVDTELCRVLVELWQKPVPVYRKGEGEANPEAMANATTDFKVETDSHVARLAQHHILDPAINRRLDRAFLKRVLPEIKKAYQCDIKQHEQFKILRYTAAEGGFLAAHRDNPTPETRHRLFTMTCNLGCTEFEGGELRFPEYGPQLFRVEPGAGIVWSTALLHELTPVKSGERYALGTHLF